MELGRPTVAVEDLVLPPRGRVLEPEDLPRGPIDVRRNGRLLGADEVVAVSDDFGIRLTDRSTPSERIRKLID